jgi:hypothetical protein
MGWYRMARPLYPPRLLWIGSDRDRADLVLQALEAAVGTGEPETWIPCRPTHPRAEWRVVDSLTGEALFGLRPEAEDA